MDKDEDEYTRIFAGALPVADLLLPDAAPESADLFIPVTAADIRFQLGSSMSGMAGPDGIKLRIVRLLPVARVALLFSSMIYFGVTPPSLKLCRTTFFPRERQSWSGRAAPNK